MIEVEKKFILSDKEKARLIKNAQFLNWRVFTDIYYDRENFSLTLKDKWLRSREGAFELKLPLQSGTERLADQYEELDDEQKIREALNLSHAESLAADLTTAGYRPICVCKTTRRKYSKEPFTIDVDIVDFQDFTYTLCEIELMVPDKSETESAIQKILNFAKIHRLAITPVRGKVIEYLKRERPNHYHVLVQAGIVKDF